MVRSMMEKVNAAVLLEAKVNLNGSPDLARLFRRRHSRIHDEKEARERKRVDETRYRILEREKESGHRLSLSLERERKNCRTSNKIEREKESR